MKKPEKMLIYLSYPVMDISSEPWYIQTLIDNTPKHWVFYRPLFPIQEQPELIDRLKYFIPEDRKQKLALTPSTKTLSVSEHTVLTLVEEFSSVPPPNHSTLLMLRDLSILSISDIVVVSCDNPDFGGRSMELLWSNILDIPTMGIVDRFLLGPWLQSNVDVIVRSLYACEELIFRGSAVDSQRKEFEKI